MDRQARKFEILTQKFANLGQKLVHHQSGYLGLDVGEGRVNRVGQPEEFPQGDEQSIAEAISYVQKICGACSKSKNLDAFNRVPADPRFRKNVCQSCEELNNRKFNRPVMTMAVQNY